jgi:hypothetical protein
VNSLALASGPRHDAGMHGWPVAGSAGVPSPGLVAAWLILGTLPTERIPLFAAYWLGEGCDGPALAELAGLHGDDPNDVRDLLPEALVECGVSIPTSDEAAAMTAFTADRCGYAPEVLGLPLGSLYGLEDEWGAGWGRSDAELCARVREASGEQLRLAGDSGTC